MRKAYKYPLADIISMVKHAGKEEPLMSAKERVDLAIAKVTTGKKLSSVQLEWLELIRSHLTENLTIEPEDFDVMPIFVNRGGSFKRINRDFNNRLEVFISQLNAAIPRVYAYAN